MSANLNTKIVTTTPYTVLSSDEVIFMNVIGPSSVILPANGLATGEDCCGDEDDDYNGKKKPVLKRSYYIKDISGNSVANPVTITSAGSKSIDSNPFAIINGGYGHIQVVYDGTNWKIIG